MCGVCLFPPACFSRQAPPRSPGSRAESFLTCPEVPNVHEFSRPRRVRPLLAMTRRSILPSPSVHKAGTRNEVFRGSLAGPPVPLSTLHRPCRHCRRITGVSVVRYSFAVGLLHPQLPAGLSRRFRTVTPTLNLAHFDRGLAALDRSRCDRIENPLKFRACRPIETTSRIEKQGEHRLGADGSPPRTDAR